VTSTTNFTVKITSTTEESTTHIRLQLANLATHGNVPTSLAQFAETASSVKFDMQAYSYNALVVWDPTKRCGDGWNGFSCLEHDFNVCHDCLYRESLESNTRGYPSLRAHRLNAHSTYRPLTWIYYHPTRDTTQSRPSAPSPPAVLVRPVSTSYSSGNSGFQSSSQNTSGSYRQGLADQAAAGDWSALENLWAYDNGVP
jgi:hypothetical protein